MNAATHAPDALAPPAVERLIDETLSRKMARRADGPYVPMAPDAVHARLLTFLGERLTGPVRLGPPRPLAGGSSKEQYAFELTAPRRYGPDPVSIVLRLEPAESFVETHRLREFQAVRAVRDRVPVPEALWVDPDGSQFGRPGTVYEFCQGVTRPPVTGAYTPRQGFGARYRALLAPQFVQHAAALTDFDWSRPGLDAFDVPAPEATEAALRGVNWWARVWDEDRLERYPLITAATRWLRHNAPPVDRLALVHGDLRGGNFLFLPETGRITAILDWEIAHPGDRHEDLAFFLSPLFTERDGDQEYAGGLLPAEEFLRRYEEASGLPVDPERLAYYDVFVHWRGAINSVGTAPRCVHGRKTHHDVRVAWTSNVGPLAMDALRQALARRS